MVRDATRCLEGKAQALGLTNSKRWGLPMPVAKIHLLEGQYSEARLFAMFDDCGLPHKKPQYLKRRSEFPTP